MKNNKYILLILLFSIILISGCTQKQANEFEIEFAGEIMHFRANLTEASMVPVYPDEQAVKDMFFKPGTSRIRIFYIPKDKENGFYAVAGYELAYKLIKINQYYYEQTTVPVETIDVNTIEEAHEISDSRSFSILMLGPSHANETAVTVEDNLIIASGKDFSETNRKYTDLDLAADKLLLILMEAEKV